MPSSAFLQLQSAAQHQSLVDIKRVLAALTPEEKAACWAIPNVIAQILEPMKLEGQAMTWIPGLQLIEMLVLAGAPVPPLATSPDGPLSPLQIAVSPTWLPHDASTWPLKGGELEIARRVLGLLVSRSSAQVPANGLSFDQWSELDPWACLLSCGPCHGLACDLVEAGVFPAAIERPVGGKVSQWPLCPLQELLSQKPVDVQARVWCAVLDNGYRLPAVLDEEPTLHHFCGLDMRPGAPLLKAALQQGLDPRALNAEHQTVLEGALSVISPSLYDAVVLLDHDLALLDDRSSDGRTVYVVLMETLKAAQSHTVVGLDDPMVANLGPRARAYRRSAQLNEGLPAAKPSGQRGRF